MSLNIPALQRAADRMKNTTLRELMHADAQRTERMTLVSADITVDFSKQLIDEEGLSQLFSEDFVARFENFRARLFNGEIVNSTEQRPALHTALRAADADVPPNIRADIASARTRMLQIAESIRAGEWITTPIRHVVCIGIGGSDLGPRMAVRALEPTVPRVDVSFVSNLDPDDLQKTLATCEPAATLFIVASKTFTTLETLTNAEAALAWLQSAGIDPASARARFIAVTAAEERARHFGIAPDNILPMWDWVGGRFSVWSCIGLPLAIAVGADSFRAFLAGAETMDRHFRDSNVRHNVPVMMAALTVWYTSVWGAQSHAVIAYENRLEGFVSHLQQLDMESVGKSATLAGEAATGPTGPVVWGGIGTNTQHSFHQLLHQGTVLTPIDLIVGLHSHTDCQQQHALLLAHCLAQSAALTHGNLDEHPPVEWRVPGNRPHSVITYPRLSPTVLGQLIALYEHKVAAESVFWNINPFDQCGVELGKRIGSRMATLLTCADAAFDAALAQAGASMDASLLSIIRRHRAT